MEEYEAAMHARDLASEDTEPVLEGYLEKMTTIFLSTNTIEGRFSGYDQRSYYLEINGQHITINRDKVDMLMPSEVWEKVKEEQHD